MPTLAELEAALIKAQRAYQNALDEIQGARANARQAARENADAVEERVKDPASGDAKVTAAEQRCATAMNALAAVESRYGLDT